MGKIRRRGRIYYIDYYADHRRIRERIGLSRDLAEKILKKREIEVIEDKFKNDMYLPHSAAANSEILFSMGVNPSVLGAGLPGGPYSGNSGSGSDIREALLVNIALSWADRELGYDPLYLMRDFNGWDPETEFRTINTVLTTLDTGAGTAKTLN